MSERYPGAILGDIPPTTTTTSASGLFTLNQQYQLRGQNIWPIGVSGESFVVESFVASTSWTVPTGVTEIDYAVVGGGGGGGIMANPISIACTDCGGFGTGGGGGGGLRVGTKFPVTPGEVFCIQIGAGGAGGRSTYCFSPALFPVTPRTFTNSANGVSSGFCSASNPGIFASGGGYGGSPGIPTNAQTGVPGGSGGSGGGASSTRCTPATFCALGGLGNFPAVSPSQGNDGGRGHYSGPVASTLGQYVTGGGGGGAGCPGCNAFERGACPSPLGVCGKCYICGCPQGYGRGALGGATTIAPCNTSTIYAGGGAASTRIDGACVCAYPGGGGGGFEGQFQNDSCYYPAANRNGQACTGGGGGGNGSFQNCGPSVPGNFCFNGGTGGSGIVNIRYAATANLVYVFSATQLITFPPGYTTADYVVVGGGGGGGAGSDYAGSGGGGGAGGARVGSSFPITPGCTYYVTVGAGGAGGQSFCAQGSSGTCSVFALNPANPVAGTTIEAAGGGGGGGSEDGGPGTPATCGLPGGSGGGGGNLKNAGTGRAGGTGNIPVYAPAQGFDGGAGCNAWGGGGGGAAAVGCKGYISACNLPRGGDGISTTITGSTLCIAGGGGGGSGDWTGPICYPTHIYGGARPITCSGGAGYFVCAGLASTGGGGGGGFTRNEGTNVRFGKAGGSGIVIVKLTG